MLAELLLLTTIGSLVRMQLTVEPPVLAVHRVQL